MNEIFKALGDQNRLRMVNILKDVPLCVCDIENALHLSQTNVSRHLKILRDLHIVKTEKKQQWVYYSLHDEFLSYNNLLSHLEDVFKEETYLKDIEERNAYMEKCMNEGCC